MIIRKENVMGISRFDSLDNKFWRYVDIYDKTYLYVLEIDKLSLYIGATVDLKRRLKAHLNRTASCWTKNYQTIELIQVYEIDEINFHDLEVFETLLTIHYAKNSLLEIIHGGIFARGKKEYIVKCKKFAVNQFVYDADKMEINLNELLEKCKIEYHLPEPPKKRNK